MINLVKILIGLAVVGTIGVAGYTVLPKKVTAPVQNTPEVVNTNPADNTGSIYLIKESGKVYWKAAENDAYLTLATDEQEIQNGAYVKTDEGLAHVVLPDNSMISVAENTEIQITYQDHKASIFQSVGDTYHRVQKLQAGASYEVRTPGTLAAVRGTRFAVNYNPKIKRTKVSVTEHTVSVRRFGVEAIATSTATTTPEIPVGMGTQIVIDPIKPGITPNKEVLKTIPLPVDSKRDAWLRRNVVLDSYVEATGDKRAFFKVLIETPTDSKSKGDTLNLLLTRLKLVSTKLNLTPLQIDTTFTPTPTTTTQPTTPTTSPTPVSTKPTGTLPPISSVPPALSGGSTATGTEQDPFLAEFDALYTKLFWVDATGAVCRNVVQMTPEASVDQLVRLATQYNRSIVNTKTLTTFGYDIRTYCKQPGDTKAILTLQTQFISEYPFSSDL